MGQVVRRDAPGAWHHAFNRGVARRRVFESREEARAFLACLARAVRRGGIEIHAYCLLPNHYHLLVRSPNGGFARELGRACNAYVRWFNRRHHRDGPLFRGRFRSRRVDDDGYWWTLVRYIDHNPVAGGLSGRPEDYPFGSAWHYARSRSRPLWLARGEVERAASAVVSQASFDPPAYGRAVGAPLTSAEQDLVERRLHACSRHEDAMLEGAISSPVDLRRWLERRAVQADGPRSEVPLASAAAVCAQVEALELAGTPSGLAEGDLRAVLLAGLLKHACGLTYRAIAERCGIGVTSARRRVELHHGSVRANPAYLELAARIAWTACRGSGDPAARDR